MGLFGGETSRDELMRLEARVAALEVAVARLSSGAGAGPAPTSGPPEPPDGEVSIGAWAAEARSLKDAGQAIAAIKLVREHTGSGLKPAKDFVDRL